ncbi:hypothetical protein EB093_03130 [bacterium]|nr:hypothetical protein [bacterium]
MNRGIQKHFRFIAEQSPGALWTNFYNDHAAGYRKWFLKEGEFNRPSYLQCRKALNLHMPELVPLWEQLFHLAGGGDLDARLLSLYCPTPYVSGCSQAVWLRYSPILVRNYDYDPNLCEARILRSKWFSDVIATTDCLWGVLDGMNEYGLSVSLSFGGKEETGEGFGIPIILRYILEFCKTTSEAVDVLKRIPTHMAYNVTVLDAYSDVTTVEVGPSSPPVISRKPMAVNQQGNFELTNYTLFSKSYERKQALIDILHDPLTTIESFINAFEYAPLFASNYDSGFGTLYTAIYNPSLRAMEYRWPYHTRVTQSFQWFEPTDIWVSY